VFTNLSRVESQIDVLRKSQLDALRKIHSELDGPRLASRSSSRR
jgi:hypothetical protein